MIGQTFSHYTIIEKLGEGGMGIVYKARDIRLGRHVAIKVLPRDLTHNKDARIRFEREARAASALDHPNIAIIHEIDETADGQAFICMAYYEGETLKTGLERSRANESEAIDLIIRTANGLKAAHEAGIIHRDIKPANIIVTAAGDVKILDFGLAKLLSDHRSGSSETSTGGTAAYMSPEQVMNAHVDCRSDLFSLGIVMYELLTGRRPFVGDHPAAVAYSILNSDPVPPRTIVPELSRSSESIVMRLLEKDPERRYQSAADLIEDLRRPEDVRHGRLRSVPWRGRFSSRHVIVTLAAIGLVVTAIWVSREISFSFSSESMGVVVLDFTSTGDDRVTASLCGGLSEILTDRLARLQADNDPLWVMATSEVKKFGVESATDAKKKLAVRYAVSGSVHREGEVYRVIVQLLETDDGRIKSSREFRRSVTQVSQLVVDIVSVIAQWLDVSLSPKTAALLAMGGTTVGAAYDQYATARGYLRNYQSLESLITAITLLQSAVQTDSTFVLAHAALAEAYWRRFEAERDVRWINLASESARKAMSLNDEVPESNVADGIVHMARGEYEHAVTSFRATLMLDPGVTAASLGLARAYDEMDDTASATRAFSDAIEREPAYWGYYNAFGAYLAFQNRLDEALAQFRKVAELAPGNIFGHNNVGAILQRQGRYPEARGVYQRSLSIEPSATAYSNLGTILFSERKFAEAASLFEKAIPLRKGNYQLWGHYAEALRWGRADTSIRNGAYREAIRLAEEMYKVNPRNADLMHRMAGYHVASGDTVRGRELLSEAYSVSSAYGYALGRIAMVYEDLGDRETALTVLKEALQRGFRRQELEASVGMDALRGDARYKAMTD